MERNDRPPATERRREPGLEVDPGARTLSIGGTTVPLPRRAGNRAVLATYVDLVTAQRGERPRGRIEVRDEDIDALAVALDLDHADLLHLLETTLGTTPAVAVGLLARLRARKLVLAGVGAVAGAVLVGGLASGAAAAPASPSGRSVQATVAPAVGAVVADFSVPTITETPDGVGLIPAASVDQDAAAPAATPVAYSDPTVTETPDGVGLIDAATVDAPDDDVTLLPPLTVDRPEVTETPDGVGLIPPASTDR